MFREKSDIHKRTTPNTENYTALLREVKGERKSNAMFLWIGTFPVMKMSVEFLSKLKVLCLKLLLVPKSM